MAEIASTMQRLISAGCSSMRVSVGTFNLNNLFSRFNFSASVDEVADDEGGMSLEFDSQLGVRVRSFQGRLVKGKDPAETQTIADRILAMNLDVLAVQEVEHIEVLKGFNRDYLGGFYPHVALVEGNDQRLIDVGVLSRLPFGAITSYQACVHPEDPDSRVFSRDLLAIEILNPTRKKKMFTLYNTHLKSRYVPFYEDQEEGEARANRRRQQQAEMISEIIAAAERPDSSYLLAGDMNDPHDSEFLRPMLTVEGHALINGLRQPVETRPPKKDTEGPGPQTAAWTYRYNPYGPTPPVYSLIDQLWLSPRLAEKQVGAFIDRRTLHGGNGSDHDPAWVVLEL